jgi:hypothetical protein
MFAFKKNLGYAWVTLQLFWQVQWALSAEALKRFTSHFKVKPKPMLRMTLFIFVNRWCNDVVLQK